jgi:hypothetical protein
MATLIHMDYLSQLTDETLENRKAHSAEAIIEESKKSLMFGQSTLHPRSTKES